MPLIECLDCRRDVSSLAEACPNCGRPVEADLPGTPVEPNGVSVAIGQAILGLVVLMLCFSWPPLFIVLALYTVGVLISRSRG